MEVAQFDAQRVRAILSNPSDPFFPSNVRAFASQLRVEFNIDRISGAASLEFQAPKHEYRGVDWSLQVPPQQFGACWKVTRSF